MSKFGEHFLLAKWYMFEQNTSAVPSAPSRAPVTATVGSKRASARQTWKRSTRHSAEHLDLAVRHEAEAEELQRTTRPYRKIRI